MNEIEQMFYDAFIDEYVNPDNKLCCTQEIQDQVVIGGLYKVDFVVNGKYVIEIDGYEFHSTKEQRSDDYRRERYLMKTGYIVIRFTGTEIFLQPGKCAVEALRLVDYLIAQNDMDHFASYEQKKGRNSCEQGPCVPLL